MEQLWAETTEGFLKEMFAPIWRGYFRKRECTLNSIFTNDFTSRLGVQQGDGATVLLVFQQLLVLAILILDLGSYLCLCRWEEIWRLIMTMKRDKLVIISQIIFRRNALTEKNQEVIRIVSLMNTNNPVALLVASVIVSLTYTKRAATVYKFGTSSESSNI